jgi:chromatin remodeling complex protein RSC6
MAETQKHRKSKKGIEIPDVAEVISSSSKKERTETKEERRERRSKRHREREIKGEVKGEIKVEASPIEVIEVAPVVEVAAEVAVEAPKEKRKRKSKSDVKDVKVVAEVISEVKDEIIPEVVEVSGEGVSEGASDSKSVVDRLAIESSFDSLLAEVDREIEALKEDKVHMKNPVALAHIKSCRAIGKKLKQLKMASLRMIKKPRPKRQSNAASGFLKPVPISEEMAKFTGWDPSDLKSRVDVTRFIWKYVKDNGLQNPTDGRQFKPDEKLGSLLAQDTDKPLMYYNLTSKIQPHFPKQQ